MIKIFEEFSPRGAFEQSLDPKKGVDASIYRAPTPLKGASVIGGSIKWDMDLTYRKWGIDIGEISLVEIVLELEMEDEDGEDLITKTIVVDSSSLMDPERIKTKIQGFPLGIEEVEIDMNHTDSPEFWKYEIYIGQREE